MSSWLNAGRGQDGNDDEYRAEVSENKKSPSKERAVSPELQRRKSAHNDMQNRIKDRVAKERKEQQVAWSSAKKAHAANAPSSDYKGWEKPTS